MENNNLPTVDHSKEAFELIKSHETAQDLIFVAPEDLRTQSMFLPEVVVIKSTVDDFHNISGKYMPKGHQTDKIGEAAGIEYLQTNCGTRTERVDSSTAYVGFAQGKKRMPDGTWRTSSICEYEFNPEMRAEEEILKNPSKFKDESAKRLKVLELKKFARQRASTGARLRVVRELTGMPIAFKPEQIKRAMVFSRVAVNTDLLLADPKTREVALEAALGVTKQIYGPPKEEQKALSDSYTVVENGDDTPTEIQGTTENDPWDAQLTETDEDRNNREMLEDVKTRRKEYDLELSPKAKEQIDEILNLNPIDYTKISTTVDRLNEWEIERKKRGK